MVVFFAIFLPFGIHKNDFCFLTSSFYKYEVLLLYPLKIVFYTNVMVLNFEIINFISYLVTIREVFVRLCYFECTHFIFTSLFSPQLIIIYLLRSAYVPVRIHPVDLLFTDFYFLFISVFKYFLQLRVMEQIKLDGTTVVIWSHLPAQAESSQSVWHRVVSRQFWSISSEGDSTHSLGNLFQCPITAQEKDSSSCSDGTTLHQFYVY